MTIQVIPPPPVPTWTQTTTLEGVPYLLAFQYSQRAARWYLSIADPDGVDVVNGMKLVVGVPLLHKCRDPRRPPGDIVVWSSTQDGSPPGLSDFITGGRCQILYVTSDVIATLLAGGLAAFVAQVQAGAGSTTASTYGQG